MKIREDQLDSLEERAREEYIDRLTGLVKEQNTGIPPGTDDFTLRRMVENGVARARAHGLTWESSIGKFVGLMFGVAPNFDEYPTVRAVLADPRLSPNERVAELFKRVSSDEWTGASRRYDMRAWGDLGGRNG